MLSGAFNLTNVCLLIQVTIRKSAKSLFHFPSRVKLLLFWGVKMNQGLHHRFRKMQTLIFYDWKVRGAFARL